MLNIFFQKTLFYNSFTSQYTLKKIKFILKKYYFHNTIKSKLSFEETFSIIFILVIQ